MTLPRLLVYTSILVLAASAAYGSEIEKEIDASPGDELHIELETGGAVEVSGWDQNRVRVEARFKGDESRLDLEKKGGRVALKIEPLSRERPYASAHRLEIRVPRRFNIRIDSAGGRLSIKDVEGTFRGQTGGGKIELERLKGHAKLSTGGGKIVVTNSELDGKVSTGGGRVEFDNVRGDLRGTSGSHPTVEVGKRDREHEHKHKHEHKHERDHEDQRDREDERDREDDEDRESCRDKESKKGDRPYQIQRAGGDVELEEAPRGATIQTGGGNIRVGRSGGSITAQTGGGDIELGPVAGSVHATTGAGRVTVKLAKTSDAQVVKIDAGVGAIKVELPEGFDGRFELETAYTRDHGRTRIKSDVELRVDETLEWDQRRGTPRKYVRARGVLGKGRGLIQISTTNGDIEIERD